VRWGEHGAPVQRPKTVVGRSTTMPLPIWLPKKSYAAATVLTALIMISHEGACIG
ncbi:MAG: hypothetical protein QOJ42_2905, partial [Acidobacteriaceae bacterium]|nr:hypothetical protein [Acidobacteriaceae bacterium]